VLAKISALRSPENREKELISYPSAQREESSEEFRGVIQTLEEILKS